MRRIQQPPRRHDEAVDLVDEEHVSAIEVGENRRDVARRSSTGPEVQRIATPISLR